MPVDVDGFDGIMEEFFETHRYDETGDWRRTPETDEDLDEVAQKANPYHDAGGRFSTRDESVYHATDAQAMEKILEGGFKTSRGGMYGGGVYFTNDPVDATHWGEKVLAVKLKPDVKVKTFGDDREFGDFQESEAVKAKEAEVRERMKDSKERYNVNDIAMNEVLQAEGFRAHRIVRKKNVYTIVHDPKDVETIDVVKKEEEPPLYYVMNPPRKKKAADRVARPLTSFQQSGDAMLQLVSNLHTTRVSAYGFTAEAEVLGVTEYAINEQLDNRICPICREMHKKRFKVADARKLLTEVVHTKDPEKLKALHPWPKQDKESVARFKELSAKELVKRGWHVPAYHPGCRGLLVHVDDVPELDDIEAEEGGAEYEASTDDFRAYGLALPEKQVEGWNKSVGLPPGEVLAALLGRDPKEMLDAVMGSKGVADASKIGVLGLDASAAGFKLTHADLVASYSVKLEQLTVDVVADAATVKGNVENLLILVARLGAERLVISSTTIDLSELLTDSDIPTPFLLISTSPKRILVAME